MEAEDQVSLPSDSLAVGSTLNSESVNRPNLDEVEIPIDVAIPRPPPSRSPSPPPRMSEQSLIKAITSAHEWVRNYNTESPDEPYYGEDRRPPPVEADAQV